MLDPNHVLSVGNKGELSPDAAVPSDHAHVERLIAAMRLRGARRIALYFHGGLVDPTVALQSAETLVKPLLDADVWPIFVVWRTGALDVAGRNVTGLLNTELVKKLAAIVLSRVWSRVASTHGARGMGGTTPTDFERYIDDPSRFDSRNDDPELDAATQDETSALAQLQAESEAAVMGDPTLQALVRARAKAPDDSAQARSATMVLRAIGLPLAKAAWATLVRFWKKRAHGLYCTVTEEVLRAFFVGEVGSALWDGMKDAAREMWEQTPGQEERHAGSFLLTRLNTYATETGASVDLVGHSAGSIAICHLLNAVGFRAPTLKVRNVALLAPACTRELFAQAIGSNPGRYDRLRVFALSDAHESRDAIHPLYPRSLLYLVSGLLEAKADTPLAGMARHLTGLPPYDNEGGVDMANFLSHQARLVTAPTSLTADAGWRSEARHHGGFIDEPVTRESVLTLLRSP